MKTVEERLSSIEKRLEQLEVKVDSLNLNFKQLLGDLKQHFDKEDERHEAIIGRLGKLDRLDDIVRILEERLPKPSTDSERS